MSKNYITLNQLTKAVDALLIKINEDGETYVDKTSVEAALSLGVKIGTIGDIDLYAPLGVSLEQVHLIVTNGLDDLYYSLAQVARTGSYNDLSNAPELNTYMQKGIDYVTAGLKSGTELGSKATAEGLQTTSSGAYSHAEGSNTIASGNHAHAEGGSTTASGDDSHAEGSNTSAGYIAHAEGYSTTASGNLSHAEGYFTTASGNYSHAEGFYATASGLQSHAEGLQTTASESGTHAEGSNTTAEGRFSHAEGEGTHAKYRNQHVFGQYNITDPSSSTDKSLQGTYILIVGNGNSVTRSNARTLDWAGNEILKGKLTVGANPTANMDVVTKQYMESIGYQNASQVNSAITSALSNITEFSIEVVQALPQTGSNGVFYFVPNGASGTNIYDEYVYVNNAWEKIGTTLIDLSNYAKKPLIINITTLELSIDRDTIFLADVTYEQLLQAYNEHRLIICVDYDGNTYKFHQLLPLYQLPSSFVFYDYESFQYIIWLRVRGQDENDSTVYNDIINIDENFFNLQLEEDGTYTSETPGGALYNAYSYTGSLILNGGCPAYVVNEWDENDNPYLRLVVLNKEKDGGPVWNSYLWINDDEDGSHWTLQNKAVDTPDWLQTESYASDYILNKPAIKAGLGLNSIILGMVELNLDSKMYTLNITTSDYVTYNYTCEDTDFQSSYLTSASSFLYYQPDEGSGRGIIVSDVTNNSFKCSNMNLTPNSTLFVYYKWSNLAIGKYNHAEGYRNFAAYSNSAISGAHALGRLSKAINTAAHAEGGSTVASGSSSHAEGNHTLASSNYSHALGSNTTASNGSAHAEGDHTTASGSVSHALGMYTIASGFNSHAQGIGTIAKHEAQFTLGLYNLEDPSTAASNARGTYILIVGNGTLDSARSNARTLDWSGNEILSGKLTLGAGPVNNMDAATKAYVDATIAAELAKYGDGDRIAYGDPSEGLTGLGQVDSATVKNGLELTAT